MPDLELSISATTRQPREGEVDGRDYHFLTPRSSIGGSRRRTSSSSPPTAATTTGRCAREVERRLEAGHSVVLEIEVQGAQQVRAAKPDSVQIFIAPPDPAVLRERLAGRGTDSAEAIDKRLEIAEKELAAQGDFDHRVVNDELEPRRRGAGGDRPRRARRARRADHLDSPADDQTTRRQASRAR